MSINEMPFGRRRLKFGNHAENADYHRAASFAAPRSFLKKLPLAIVGFTVVHVLMRAYIFGVDHYPSNQGDDGR
jgi:hypothetical protein